MGEENADAADVLADGGGAGDTLRVRSIGDSALRLLAGGYPGSGDVLELRELEAVGRSRRFLCGWGGTGMLALFVL